jgi:hypothetical protein
MITYKAILQSTNFVMDPFLKASPNATDPSQNSARDTLVEISHHAYKSPHVTIGRRLLDNFLEPGRFVARRAPLLQLQALRRRVSEFITENTERGLECCFS